MTRLSAISCVAAAVAGLAAGSAWGHLEQPQALGSLPVPRPSFGTVPPSTAPASSGSEEQDGPARPTRQDTAPGGPATLPTAPPASTPSAPPTQVPTTPDPEPTGTVEPSEPAEPTAEPEPEPEPNPEPEPTTAPPDPDPKQTKPPAFTGQPVEP